MVDKIAFDPDRRKWYVLRSGLSIAASFNRIVLERKFPDATVEEQ